MSKIIKPEGKSVIQAWKPILATAAWIVASFCSFLTFPIKISAQSDFDGTILACANVLVALVIGLLSLFATVRTKRFSRRFWLYLASIFAGLFVGAFAIFLFLRAIWTCQYTTDIRLVIGGKPTIDLANYLAQKSPNLVSSCTELLMDYAGDTERMFPISDLIQRFVTLSFVFFGVWIFLTIVVLAIGFGLTSKASSNNAPTKRRQ